LIYQLEYVIDIPIFGEPTYLRVMGVIDDGVPPTGEGIATSCTGQHIVCDPIPLNEWGPENFVSGGPLSETEETILMTPPSASGNSSPTTWTITPVEEKPIPVILTALVEYPDSTGTASGTGTGYLVNGVLTYDMEYVIDLVFLSEPATLTIEGVLFDGEPPTGLTAVPACEGDPLICDGVDLEGYRTENFESGGPISETEETILYVPESASGRTPPSTLTITPVDNGDGGNGGGCAIGNSGRFDPTLPAILFAGLGLLGWRRLKARR
jgi:hypothetical protein